MVPEDAILGTFGDRIRALRKRKGLSQKVLADSIGTRESTISRYENDRRTYQWDSLIKLADALDTSVDYLLGRTTVSVPVDRLVSDGDASDGRRPFLEAYSSLRPDAQNLLMERAMTLYEVQSKDENDE
ncbi:MAG: helix-turn-helix domain-containing protein [Clostridiales Family XIII bacterium]|jgi:transcriptional regulator with XRE-family HTH domain|nr:helix-turn-helix domain-containing protein [Clostridiales Family XIII bacterium]